MKICRNLFHLITPLACFAVATAQADLAPGRILSLNLDPQSVTTLQLRPGFVTSVRLPEAVSYHAGFVNLAGGINGRRPGEPFCLATSFRSK